jgi:hypothetical protein
MRCDEEFQNSFGSVIGFWPLLKKSTTPVTARNIATGISDISGRA